MSHPNQFYRLSATKEAAAPYDILDLGETRFRGFGIAFSYGNGRYEGGESHSTATTAADYDLAFFKKMIKIDPPYKAEALLAYHFDHFVQNNGAAEVFLKHMQYVIAPMLERAAYKEHHEITHQWTKTKTSLMLKKQLHEKNDFLLKMYQNAVEYSPSSPLSVTTQTFAFGEHFGYDKDTTKRIVNELVAEGYLTSTLGMKQIMITMDGVAYLRELESLVTATAPIHVNVGNNSIVQMQHSTSHSTQHAAINFDPEKLSLLVTEIRSGLEELKKHLSLQDAEHLVAETDYLERSLSRQSTDPSLLNAVTRNIFEILKAVPANIMANIITAQIPL